MKQFAVCNMYMPMCGAMRSTLLCVLRMPMGA